MQNELPAQLQTLRATFESGVTKTYEWRRSRLLQLKNALLQTEEEIYTALRTDLNKSKEETWITELGFVLAEINHALKHLKRWMAPKKVGTNLLNFPSKSFIQPEPLGVVLIIAPWNYPLQLLLAPLVGALAAGNCVVLKPSELAPATASLLQQLIDAAFQPSEVLLVQGDGATVVPQLMESFRFDHLFYTGSIATGKKIYELAAKSLVPVTLELGGKSPCVVAPDADLKVAARRIALTKFSNAGQMCVAPDYLLVHRSVEEMFLKELRTAIDAFYGTEVRDDTFGKIINRQHFHRLQYYLKEGSIFYGGTADEVSLTIAPTVLTHVPLNAPVMQEEIFGPLLPVVSWQNESEVLDIIKQHQNPLAFYVFTQSGEKAKWWLSQVPSGGACINNTAFHLTNPSLPFGGRGNSGTGAYHGHFSFDVFSHRKAVMATPTWFDPTMKYPPYKGKLPLLKRLFG